MDPGKEGARVRKQAQRKRERAGFQGLHGKYVLQEDLPRVQPYLRTAEEVQRMIEEKEGEDD